MPLVYKIDVLAALGDKGYTTYKLTRGKLLSAVTVQQLREGKPVIWGTLERICQLLECQPGDLLEYREGD